MSAHHSKLNSNTQSRLAVKPPNLLRYRLAVILLCLSFLLPPNGAQHLFAAAVDPSSRPALPLQLAPRPHIQSSGSVGTPTQLSLATPLDTAHAAAMQSSDDWQADFSDDFEAGLSANWQVFDESDDGLNTQWGIDDFYAVSGGKALWVASAGTNAVDPANFYYPGNLSTWLVSSNPFNLSTAQMADVQFSMRYETEPENDYVFVGASVDGQNFYGDYYFGDSGGWDSFNLDLSEFLGYPQVYIGWYFYSDAGNDEYEGVWIDDVEVWSYVDSGPAQGNESIRNGDFETGNLNDWTVPSGSTVITTKATNPQSGIYSAYFGGIPNADEVFYQALNMPDSDVNQATVGFWVNQFGEETKIDADYFCAGIFDAGLQTLLIDLGCLNGAEATAAAFNAQNWREVEINLNADEWSQIRGKTVNLAFQMYTDATLDTSVLIDDVTFETVTGGSQGDRLEPNDTVSQASAFTLAETLTDLTIDGDNDVDVFKVTASGGGTLTIDVDAASNGSPLDAIAGVVDAADQQLCENDDDGQTVDPYVSCTLPAAGDYYVSIASYDGRGDRSFAYSLTIQFSSSGVPPTPTPPAPTPTPQPPAGGQRKWTAIVYIDGDNNLCDSYPGLITRMQNELGAKIGVNGFLNIAVLIDLNPRYCNGQGGTTRYLIQPNGQYTDNVNRWNMGELNMGDPQTLINFARWAMQNYPADHYYLAIDNHGGGVSGISWDDTNGEDNISNDELFTALKEVTQNGQRKIDVFAYEACLMGMYENVYDIRNFTDYIFAFPTISFTNNASYPSYLGDAHFTAQSDGRQLGDIMFDVYYAAVTQPYVVSLIDSSKVGALHTAVNNWANALQGAVAGSAAALANARTAAQKVEANNDNVISNEDPFVDLWDLADKAAAQGIAGTEAAALKSAIEAAVVRVKIRPATANIPWNYSRSHGLTIFWPQTPNGAYSKYVGGEIYNSTRDGRWDEFLTTFFAGSGGRGRSAMAAEVGAVDRLVATNDPTASLQFIYLPLIQRQ
jgi:hypothetical protein